MKLLKKENKNLGTMVQLTKIPILNSSRKKFQARTREKYEKKTSISIFNLDNIWRNIISKINSYRINIDIVKIPSEILSDFYLSLIKQTCP